MRRITYPYRDPPADEPREDEARRRWAAQPSASADRPLTSGLLGVLLSLRPRAALRR